MCTQRDRSIGDQVTPEWTPANAVAPLTISYIGHQAEGPYFQGTYANGVFGVVFPEELV